MKIISISNRKGGNGKSTVSFHLAHSLKSCGYRTLLIDMDSQASLTHIIGLTYNKDVYGALSGEYPISLAILNVEDTLDFLPTSAGLENIDIAFANVSGREKLLANVLKDLDYDYIIIDTSPSVGLALINCLVASTHVIVPVNADYMSYDGLSKFNKVIAQTRTSFNPSLKFPGVVINSTRNSNHSREIESLIDEEYTVLASLTLSVAIADAMVEGKPLSNHPNELQFEELCTRVVEDDF